MSIQITSANYNNMNTMIGNLLNSGAYSTAVMSIYSDSGITNLVNDSAGAIQNRQIASITVVQPSTDTITNVTTNGNITCVFSDGTSFVCTDNVDACWAKIDGIVYVPKRFNSA